MSDGPLNPSRFNLGNVASKLTLKPFEQKKLKLTLSPNQIRKILQESSGSTELERELVLAMKGMGPEKVAQQNTLEDLAKKVQRRMEIRVKGWVIKPDLGTTGKGLYNLLLSRKKK